MAELSEYFRNLEDTASTGDATEESYYEDLKNFLEAFSEENGCNDVKVTTLPRKSEGGNPDFRMWNGVNEIIGYVEAKLPSSGDLDDIEESEQLERYRSTFDNVILTNFVEFRLFRKGEQIAKAELADVDYFPEFGSLQDVSNEEEFFELLEKFFSHSHPSINDARSLAIELAKRTKFMRRVVLTVLEEQMVTESGDIYGFYEAFNQFLMPDLDELEFADIYSQTITYGLLVARTRVSGEFSRHTAAKAIPNTIGVLRDIFNFISAGDLPTDIEWIVDEISHILAISDVDLILSDYFEDRATKNPLIHFYETFLEEFDPETRQQKGVYYTPEPVINFITRTVHSILKSKFDRDDGLAHENVTILDPAAGTMGFPAGATEIALNEFEEKYGSGAKSSLLSDHILKNFYAFELLIAAYTIGHLKMSVLFEESGYELRSDERIKLFLTNTLEPEEAEQTKLPIASSIADESKQAHEVKKETPILAILGNPPYSGHSENQGEWIESLIADYRKGYDLSRRSKWLQDDYVKFIRWAQWKLSDSEEGVLAYITNHGYLDNPTFLGMRQELLKEFDQIYVIDLHGNIQQLETPPDGGVDENVFPDIKQGVAIGIFVKKDGGSEDNAAVYHGELWGTRDDKYEYLNNNSLDDIEWNRVEPREPHYLFVPRDPDLQGRYHKWSSIEEIFKKYSQGIVTGHKKFALSLTPSELHKRVERFLNTDNEEEARKLFSLSSSTWSYDDAVENLKQKDWKEQTQPILTGPFDHHYTIYDADMHVRPLREVSKHMVAGPNITLGVTRRVERTPFQHAFVADTLLEHHAVSTKEVNYQFPLYLYSNARKNTYTEIENPDREYNVKERLLNRLSTEYSKSVLGEDVFNYIYAILYAPPYRIRYSKFTESDFPKIPFPENHDLFYQIVEFGEELINLHLLKHPKLSSPGVYFRGDGTNLVSEKTGEYYRHYDAESEQFHLNGDQYFTSISKEVWEYEIGAKQVLRKWVEQRIGEKLSLEDIREFCKIVRALEETIEIQDELGDYFDRVESNYLSLNLSDQQKLNT